MFGERRIESRVYIQVLGSFGLINLNENLKGLSILKNCYYPHYRKTYLVSS